MKCDLCEVNEADFSLDFLKSSANKGLLLCASCASSLPFLRTADFSANESPVDIANEKDAYEDNIICPVCFTDRKSLLQNRLAGCPRCYETFRNEIRLIQGQNREINEPVRN